MSSDTYINTRTLEYPLHQGDIRLVYPNMGAEFVLPDDTFMEVEDTPIPEFGYYDVFSELQPLLIEGKWVRQFSVRAMTEDEKEEKRQYFIAHGLGRPSQQTDLTQPGGVPDVIG